MMPHSQCPDAVADLYVQSVVWDVDWKNQQDIVLNVVHHNIAAFRIEYYAANLRQSPSLLQQHYESYRCLDKDSFDDSHSETIAKLRRPFESLMAQLGVRPDSRTLHSYLYAPHFILEAKVDPHTNQVKPCLKRILPWSETGGPGEHFFFELPQYLNPLLCTGIDTYCSTQLQVLDETRGHVPTRVSIKGKEYFFKPWRGRSHGYYELEAYANIRRAQPLLSNALICHLHGLVIDDSDVVPRDPEPEENEDDEDNEDNEDNDYAGDAGNGSRLVGLLLSYIEAKGDMKALATLDHKCSDEDRHRWSLQVTETVRTLHASNIVWGDAKPDNVLINQDGDAVLIDFGGSHTPGWVEEENQETIQGDCQGVERINKWLSKCSDKSFPVLKLFTAPGHWDTTSE